MQLRRLPSRPGRRRRGQAMTGKIIRTRGKARPRRTGRRKIARKRIVKLLALFDVKYQGQTSRAYQADVAAFTRWRCARDRIQAIGVFLSAGRIEAAKILQTYQTWLMDRFSAATVNRRTTPLLTLLRMARAEKLIDWEITSQRLLTHPCKNTQRGPERHKYVKMLEAARRTGGAKGARDEAAIRLLHDLGLRRAEVCGLNMEDVDGTCSWDPRIWVKGKGRHEREPISLPRETREALERWTSFRGTGPGALFKNFSRAHERKRITVTGLGKLVAYYACATNCKTTPHGLRHLAISTIIRRGWNLVDVQKFSRHRDIRTLQRYYDQEMGVAGDIAADLAEGT